MTTAATQHVLTDTRCKEIISKLSPFTRYCVISAAGNPNWEVIYTNNHLPTIQEYAEKARANLGYGAIIVLTNPNHPFNKA